MSNFPTPSFSVVIPLFNKERSVNRCVDSVLKQSFPAAEIIIVNDGSTDNSLPTVQKIIDPRIRLFSQKNGGVSSARNSGIAQARHEYIALLDADDEWDSSFLEKMAFLIQKFPKAGLYYATHNNVQNKTTISTIVPSLPLGYCGEVNIFNLITDQGPCSSAVVIRKSFLAKTGLFEPKLVKGEDIDLWIRFALNDPVAIYNAPLSTCHGETENRAMQKLCAPQLCLISNLGRYEKEAQKNPDFYRYLQRMRMGHICNFLGGQPCEMADAHHEIEKLDLRLLPPIWKVIRYSPRCLRWIIFKTYIHGVRIVTHLSHLIRPQA